MKPVDRATLIICLTLAIVSAVFLLLPVLARAQALPFVSGTQEDGIGFTLFQEPCVVPGALAAAAEERRASMKNALIRFPQGVIFAGCWFPHPERVDRIIVIDEQGNGGYVERAIFGPSV